MSGLKKILTCTGHFFKGSVNVLKLSLWIFILQLLISLFSIVLISSGENAPQWVKLLSIVMTLSELLIIYVVARTSVYTDFQIFKNNYIRKNKGEEIPKFRQMREYRWYKGFIAGFIACLPSIILIFLGALQSPFSNQSNVFGKIAMAINFVYTVPVLNFGGSNNLFIIFYGLFLATAASGTGYYIYGLKLENQFFELQKGNR